MTDSERRWKKIVEERDALLLQVREQAEKHRVEMVGVKACLAGAERQINELKEWIWNQGHIRVASHRIEDCARCKLEAKEGVTQKRIEEPHKIEHCYGSHCHVMERGSAACICLCVKCKHAQEMDH